MNAARKPRGCIWFFIGFGVVLGAGLGFIPRVAHPELVIHCAAVMADAMEELKVSYQTKSPTQFNLIYDGSGALLGRLRAAQSPGDIFIAAEISYMTEAEREGLVTQSRPIAKMTPVLAVAPGNPKKVAKLADLVRDDVRVSLADPDAAAAGLVTRRLLKSLSLWERFSERIRAGGVTYQGTVSKAAADVAIGAADVTVAWLPTARSAKLEQVHDPVLDASPEDAMLGILKHSQRPDAARLFAEYLAGPEALAVLDRLGFGKVTPNGR